MVVPKGPAAAATGSTWIHCRSSVDSAKPSMRFWSTVRYGLYPRSCPARPGSSATVTVLVMEDLRSLRQAEQPARVLLEDLGTDLGLDVEPVEVGDPPVRGDEGEVRAEEHLVLQ